MISPATRCSRRLLTCGSSDEPVRERTSGRIERPDRTTSRSSWEENFMTDKDLKRHIEDALNWEPSFDAAEIGVSVDNGVVTLRGDVATYVAKSTAERVTLGVYGVKA